MGQAGVSVKENEQLELIGILLRELVDAVSLNQYYASLLARPARNWSDLTKAEQEPYVTAALIQAQAVFAELGWGMDVECLEETARS